MATENILLEDLGTDAKKSLAALSSLSRDLEAFLAKPKERSISLPEKYDRIGTRKVSESEGDKAYRDDLRALSARNLGFAFGRNKSMSSVEMDIRNALEAAYGRSGKLGAYVAASTEAICQVLMGAAENMGVGEGDQLVTAKDNLVSDASDPTKGIITALSNLNNGSLSLFNGKVYTFLRPLSLEYLNRLQARVGPMLEGQDIKLKFLLNPQAQKAVLRQILKKRPSDTVLLPEGFGSVSSVNPTSGELDALKAAFAKYSNKDVTATFDYYRQAVKDQIDLTSGLQVGEVSGNLSAAVASLKAAERSLARTPSISSSARNYIASEMRKVASKIGRINAKSSSAGLDIAEAVAELLVNVLGLTSATLGAGATSGVYYDAIRSFVTTLQSVNSAEISRLSIDVLEAQDVIKPASLTQMELNPALSIRNDIIGVILSLKEAYNNTGSLGLVGEVAEGPVKRMAATSGFKDVVNEAIATALKLLKDSIQGNKQPKVHDPAFKAGIVSAMDQLLGVTIPLTTSVLTLNKVGVSGLGISDMKYLQIADGRVATLSSLGSDGRSIANIVEEAVSRAWADARRSNSTGNTTSRATVDAALKGAELISDALQGARIQAESVGTQILTRSNPAGGSLVKQGLYGAGSLVGNHAASALLNRQLEPSSGSVASYAVDFGPSVATVAAAHYYMDEGADRTAVMAGAVAHAVLRGAFKYIPALRFSENPVIKALQYPTNWVAAQLGDDSMGPSSVAPASPVGHEDNLAEYVCTLAKTNSYANICYIANQLCANGLRVGLVSLRNSPNERAFSFGVSPSAGDTAMCGSIAETMAMIKCLCGSHVEANISGARYETVGLTPDLLALCEEKAEMCGAKAEAVNAATPAVNGFILEPNYNMNVYSGEDQVSYLQPAPKQTSQSGIVQLDNAIARAKRLGPNDKMQEGIGDLQDVAVIRATPKTARMIENMGVGVSLGMSRSNPNHELVALEVEGDNGLMPVAPARQMSVPQGALNHAKIGHAPDVDVSPHGLFNRGAFNPLYGR